MVDQSREAPGLLYMAGLASVLRAGLCEVFSRGMSSTCAELGSL